MLPQRDLYAPDGSFTQLVPDMDPMTINMPPEDTGHQVFFSSKTTPSPSKNTNKKVKQWRRWEDNVIPGLLQLYLNLLGESMSLRDVRPISDACGCGAAKIKVIGVYFESMTFFWYQWPRFDFNKHRVCDT